MISKLCQISGAYHFYNCSTDALSSIEKKFATHVVEFQLNYATAEEYSFRKGLFEQVEGELEAMR